MTVKFRITKGYDFLLAGRIYTGSSFISLNPNGNVTCNEFYTKELGFDEGSLVDEEHLVDEEYLISEDQSMESFLAWFFGIDLYELEPNRVEFLEGKNIIANEIKQNQSLGD